jgi:arylsulfatase A-like enzyme
VRQTLARPYDHWPLQRGFERFYGFFDGDDRSLGSRRSSATTAASIRRRSDGYHLSEDLVDQAPRSSFANSARCIPRRPFLTYLSFGACHAPHQAPRPFIEKYRGRFDHGWDVERELVLERQKELGIVPPDQELAPRNDDVRAWEDLSEDERVLYRRMQEVFAGFLDHTDVQIGRYLAALDEVGATEDTLIVLLSDNGASQEGGSDGTLNEMGFFNGVSYTVEEMLVHLDDLGGPGFDNHYPRGWAMAGNTPLKRYKQNTHGGGIRDPLVLSWPGRMGEDVRGGVRGQYHHVVDLAPTILEACEVAPPGAVDGVDQLPWHGTSLLYTVADAAAPTRKRSQVYEMLGHRAIWADGWKAVSFHVPGTRVDDDTWELYHLDEDFAELHDRAEDEPERLRALVDRWWAEAGAMGLLPVIPTSDRLMLILGGREGRPRATPETERFTYYGGIQSLPEGATHDLRNASHRIEVSLSVPEEGPAEGVLFAQGGHSGGYTLYVQGGELRYEHNFVGYERFEVVVPAARLTPGAHVVSFAFAKNPADSGGTATLAIDGEEIGSGDIGRTVPIRYAADEGFDVGCDRGTAVSDRYASPFPFTGVVEKVVVDCTGALATLEDMQASARAALARQ